MKLVLIKKLSKSYNQVIFQADTGQQIVLKDFLFHYSDHLQTPILIFPQTCKLMYEASDYHLDFFQSHKILNFDWFMGNRFYCPLCVIAVTVQQQGVHQTVKAVDHLQNLLTVSIFDATFDILPGFYIGDIQYKQLDFQTASCRRIKPFQLIDMDFSQVAVKYYNINGLSTEKLLGRFDGQQFENGLKFECKSRKNLCGILQGTTPGPKLNQLHFVSPQFYQNVLEYHGPIDNNVPVQQKQQIEKQNQQGSNIQNDYFNTENVQKLINTQKEQPQLENQVQQTDIEQVPTIIIEQDNCVNAEQIQNSQSQNQEQKQLEIHPTQIITNKQVISIEDDNDQKPINSSFDNQVKLIEILNNEVQAQNNLDLERVTEDIRQLQQQAIIHQMKTNEQLHENQELSNQKDNTLENHIETNDQNTNAIQNDNNLQSNTHEQIKAISQNISQNIAQQTQSQLSQEQNSSQKNKKNISWQLSQSPQLQMQSQQQSQHQIQQQQVKSQQNLQQQSQFSPQIHFQQTIIDISSSVKQSVVSVVSDLQIQDLEPQYINSEQQNVNFQPNNAQNLPTSQFIDSFDLQRCIISQEADEALTTSKFLQGRVSNNQSNELSSKYKFKNNNSPEHISPQFLQSFNAFSSNVNKFQTSQKELTQQRRTQIALLSSVQTLNVELFLPVLFINFFKNECIPELPRYNRSQYIYCIQDTPYFIAGVVFMNFVNKMFSLFQKDNKDITKVKFGSYARDCVNKVEIKKKLSVNISYVCVRNMKIIICIN
ncbi:Hypothetical_protein [Hexamita inflata]|uniref:Hypothetical_protein n=1 Tax=Hexamita inflata TaxID=28002 RepID=A0AA86N7U4_9EUKA|nr:Hypothetical protein HINF_LOCUS1961 [Hexamita inflata]CAI9934656.1 Hypothetical protein HINF_LOCUS22301 [Hexamita inflata]